MAVESDSHSIRRQWRPWFYNRGSECHFSLYRRETPPMKAPWLWHPCQKARENMQMYSSFILCTRGPLKKRVGQRSVGFVLSCLCKAAVAFQLQG